MGVRSFRQTILTVALSRHSLFFCFLRVCGFDIRNFFCEEFEWIDLFFWIEAARPVSIDAGSVSCDTRLSYL